MKTHYATVERANESDNQDYWSNTLCGLEYTESPLTDKMSSVTCKNCLKIYWSRDRKTELTGCRADRDGECDHPMCPQNRDNEPYETGRTCPLPWWTNDPDY